MKPQEEHHLEAKKTSVLRQKLNNYIPNWCLKRLFCCKPCHLNKQERLFAKAQDSLEDETDIINLFKQLRHLEAFYRTSL